MTTTPEEVSGSHALTTSEQLFCTLTAWHERVSIYVKGGANIAGALWRVYAVNGSQRTLLVTGKSTGAGNEPIMLGPFNAVPGQGDTIALYGLNPFGVTPTVKAYLVGWDPSAAVSPAEASTVGSVNINLTEQDVATLTGGYVNLSVTFNPNSDPLANQCQLRLYALLGGADRFLLQEKELSQAEAASGSFPWLQNYEAGATEFILTAQGRYGTSAITATGVLEGNTGSAGAGGGGGPPVGSYWPTQTTIPATVTNPELAQATATSDTPTQAILLKAQDAFAGATGANQVGGDIEIHSGAGSGSPEVAGAIHFKVGGASGDSFTVKGNGTVSASESLEAPVFIVTDGITRTPAVLPALNTPTPSLVQPGSISLSNTFNPLWVQDQSQTWRATPWIDGSGQIQFDPASATAGINQGQSISGAGAPLYIISQAAKTGSTSIGGDISLILGADDPNSLYPASPKYIWFGAATGPNANEPATNYVNMATLAWTAGGVPIFNMGRGDNGIGGGVAGNEISGFAELGIAVENQVPINNIIAGTGPTSTYLEITDHDTFDDAAWSLAYFANHPTSGDVAGVQILYTETALAGGGVARFVDMQKAGVRELSLRPWAAGVGLSGGQLVAEAGYLGLNAAVGIIGVCSSVQFLNAGAFGPEWDNSTAQLIQNTGPANTSVEFQVAGTGVLQITPTKLQNLQGIQRKVNPQTIAYQILATDDIVAANIAGGGTVTLPASPNDGDQYVCYNSSAASIITLDGNGHNIKDATSSATTKNIAAGGTLKVVYSSSLTLWMGAPGF